MARGMLTGKLDLKNLPDGDFRKTGYNPQFNEDNVDGVKLQYCLPARSQNQPYRCRRLAYDVLVKIPALSAPRKY